MSLNSHQAQARAIGTPPTNPCEEQDVSLAYFEQLSLIMRRRGLGKSVVDVCGYQLAETLGKYERRSNPRNRWPCFRFGVR